MNPLGSLAAFSLRRPAVVSSIVLLASLILALGIPRIQRETTVRTFLGAHHPTVAALDAHINAFAGGYPVIIAYSCDETPNCTTVFDPPALEMAHTVARELRSQFGVREVLGPANTPLMVLRDGDLAVRRFVGPDGVVLADRETLAEKAASDPLWIRSVVSEEGRVGALILEVSSSEGAVQRNVAAAIEEALNPWREAGWEFHLVGELVDFVFAGIDAERDSQAMVPGMVLVLFVVLWALLRSITFAIATIATMGLAFLWTQGAMGWAGVELNAVTTVTPSLVFAVGILDGVHVVTQLSRRMWEMPDRSRQMRRQALLDVTQSLAGPCLFTSLTTMGAFLAFTVSGIASFAEFGLLAAWGVLIALLLTFTVLPIGLAHLPDRWLPVRPPEPAWRDFLQSTIDTVRARRAVILAVAALVTAVTLVGVFRARVVIDPHQLAGETNRTTQWSHWVTDHLRETETLELALTLPDGVPYTDPEALDLLETISRWLDREVEGIGHAQSILGPLHRVNRLLHGDQKKYERHERDATANSQLGLILSLNDGTALERWVSAQPGGGEEPRHAVRISAEAISMTTTKQAATVERVEAYLQDSLPEGWSYALAGSVPMYLDMMMALEHNQLRCFAIAGAVCFVLMAFFLGSTRLSLLALIPSVLPCIVTVGLLGLWDYGLDPASTMVATIILGVAVDDGIHLLAHFRQARVGGAPAETAIAAAIRHVGRAVVVSSLVLMAAFWSLTFSPSAPVASFGFLAGIAILIALVADLLVLPALVCTQGIARRLPVPEVTPEGAR